MGGWHAERVVTFGLSGGGGLGGPGGADALLQHLHLRLRVLVQVLPHRPLFQRSAASAVATVASTVQYSSSRIAAALPLPLSIAAGLDLLLTASSLWLWEAVAGFHLLLPLEAFHHGLREQSCQCGMKYAVLRSWFFSCRSIDTTALLTFFFMS
jgi:hypothetical protein